MQVQDKVRTTIKASDGATLSYYIRIRKGGHAGIPLLMLSGLTTVAHDWDKFEEDLVQSRTLVIMDNRGMGESNPIPSPDTITIPRMAKDAYQVITHALSGLQPNAPPQFDLLGMSMGGFISIRLSIALCSSKPVIVASDQGETSLTDVTASSTPRLRKLILVCTSAQSPVGSKLLDAFGAPSENETKESRVRRMASVNFFRGFEQKYPERFNELVKLFMAGKRPIQSIFAQTRATSKKRFSLHDYLSNIKVPTLVLHGTDDLVVPIENADAFVPLLGGTTTYHRLLNHGHVLYEGDHGWTAKEVSRFLDEKEFKL
ncbi:hypothetical protein HDU76_008966 [Blyttiomyces sp. JEL0837]|nr:hypothetical protein HDU76_008966 [Blyttiomyces sp. JEL0837]